MPVQKFRTFDEAREALWGEPGSPEHLRRVAWLWAFGRKLSPRRYPAGVHRYRSIQEAGRARERWERQAGRE